MAAIAARPRYKPVVSWRMPSSLCSWPALSGGLSHPPPGATRNQPLELQGGRAIFRAPMKRLLQKIRSGYNVSVMAKAPDVASSTAQLREVLGDRIDELSPQLRRAARFL